MKHLHGNILCVVDTETTGLRPRFNDIIEVCILPLDSQLNPCQGITPYAMELQPKRPQNFDPDTLKVTDPSGGINPTVEGICRSKERVLKIMQRGMDPYLATDLLVEWFDKLHLPPRRRLMPVACNWVFDREFIIDWIGQDLFEDIFDPRYRDLLSMSLYENDVDDWNSRPFSYQKNSLKYICNALGVERPRVHTAFDDCVATAKCYKRMVQRSMIVGPELCKPTQYSSLQSPERPTSLSPITPAESLELQNATQLEEQSSTASESNGSLPSAGCL